MNLFRSYLRQAGTALRFLLFSTLILGVAYPLAIFGIGQLTMPFQANGSILKGDGGTPAASALIVQTAANDAGVQDQRWFHARPSAVQWDPASSSASNLGPNDPKLLAAVDANRAAIAKAENVSAGQVPSDAVTSSGSGLDPDISPDYARIQIPRVAAAQGLNVEQVKALVQAHTTGGLAAFLGQPSVNVTALNLEVAAAAKAAAGSR